MSAMHRAKNGKSAVIAGYDGAKLRYNVAVGTETVSLKPECMTQQVSGVMVAGEE